MKSSARAGTRAAGPRCQSQSPPILSWYLIRAAEEGEVDETLAEVLAKLEVSEGDEGEGKSGDSPEEKRPRGLGPEGRVQAVAVGVELSSVLYSYDATKARVCHAPDSPSGAGSAKALVAQLEDESLGSQKLVAVQESLGRSLG